MKLILAGGIKDEGRKYRAMFCPNCGDVRMQVIDFVEAIRNDRGIFARFKRRCTGIPAGKPKNENHPKLVKYCQTIEIAFLSATQWRYLMRGDYY